MSFHTASKYLSQNTEQHNNMTDRSPLYQQSKHQQINVADQSLVYNVNTKEHYIAFVISALGAFSSCNS